MTDTALGTPHPLQAGHDAAITAAWRQMLPPDTLEAGFQVSFCVVACDPAWVTTAATGEKREIVLSGPVFDAITKAHVNEFLPDGRGTWITLSGYIRGGEFRYERDWTRRTYWHQRPVGEDLWQPPSNPAKIRPSDTDWHTELVRGQRRSAEFMPEWMAAITAPPAPLDGTRALPQHLAQLANQAPTDAWIQELGAQLLAFTQNMGNQLDAFQAPPDSTEGDSIRAMVLENVPLEARDVLWQRDASELQALWTGLTGQPWPATLLDPPAGVTIASLESGPVEMAELLGRLVEALDDAAAEMMEAWIRR